MSKKKSAEKSAGANKYKAEKEQRAQERKRLSRLTKVENLISEAEEELALLKQQLEAPENASDCAKLMELTELIESKSCELDEYMEEWEELSSC